MNRWECQGKFDYADTRMQAVALFGADPELVNFAGFCEKSPTKATKRIRMWNGWLVWTDAQRLRLQRA